MALTCPVKSHPDWKPLVNKVGESEAYFLWNAYEGVVPSNVIKERQKSIIDLRKEIGIPYQINESNKPNILKKIKNHNTKNDTSHSVTFTRIGESQRLKVNLLVDFTSYSPKARQERAEMRSEEGKVFSEPLTIEKPFSRDLDYYMGDEQLMQQEEEIFFQKLSNKEKENYLTSKRTIRDLAIRIANKAGIKIQYIFDKNQEFKGKLERNTATINLAYATLDTPIHEILGHPIIREIKKNNKTLYQNLLRELEFGKGKEVFDRISKTYENNAEEEAIVELLGLYTANKLDKTKDKGLISLLKKLIKDIKTFIKGLYTQQEISISKLSDNITLNDISNLLIDEKIEMSVSENYETLFQKATSNPFETTANANTSTAGSKKKLSNLKTAFETILDRLERRREILETLGRTKQVEKQTILLSKLNQQYKKAKYLEGITLFLEEGHKMFDSIQEELKDLYEGKPKPNVVRRMGSFVSSYTVMLNDTAKGLYAERKIATEEELDKIKTLELEVARLKNIVDNMKDDWLNMARESTADFLSIFQRGRTREEILQMLSVPVKDIGTINTWFTAILEANDESLALIGKAVLDTKELARQEIIRVQQDLVDAKQKLEKNGVKDTHWMYARHDGVKNGDFVTERDWITHDTEKVKMYNLFTKAIGKSYYEYKDLSKKDKIEFVKSLSKEQKIFITKFKKIQQNFYNEYELSQKEVNTLKDEMKSKLSPDEYETWLKFNVEVKNGEEIIPRGKNKDYEQIQADPIKKEYYDKVIKLKQTLSDHFPQKFRSYRLAPQIRIDSVERMKIGDFIGLAEDAKESYKIFEDEEKRGSNLRLVDEEGNLVNFLPIYFSNRIENTKNLTEDTTSAMIAFSNMAINRREMSAILDSLELARGVIRHRGILRTTATGKSIESRKKYAGEVETEVQIDVEKGAGNVYKRLEQFLLDVVYGKKDVPLGEFFGADIARMIDTVSMHTALVQLGVNLFAGINNVNVGKAMLRIEAASKQFFSYRDLLYADKIYAIELPKTIANIGQRQPNSFMDLWLQKYDTLENYDEQVSNMDIERKTVFGQMFRKSTIFFMNKMGEHYIHGRSSLALANQFRFDPKQKRFVHKSNFYKEIKDLELSRKSDINSLDVKTLKENGTLKATIKDINDKYNTEIKKLKSTLDEQWEKLTNYIDAQEIVNKRLVLKKEFEGPNSKMDHLDFTNMQHSINQELNGNYGVDRAAIQRYAWGRAIMMFHKWMKPYWDRRYKNLRYDHRKQMEVEGYYTTVFNFANQLRKDLRSGQFSLMKNWSSLTTQERANFIKAMTEVGYLIGIAILASAVMGMREGGDDDSWALNMTAYQLNRLFTEVGVMTPGPWMVTEFLTLVQSPAAGFHMVDDMIKILDVPSWFNEIERGKYEGMYEIQRNLIKVTPLAKQIHDYTYPEEKLVFYNNFK